MQTNEAINSQTEASDFQAALSRASHGSEEDLRYLIEKYGHHIKRVVRRRLDVRLRSKFDSVDFVQMVWASFFRNREALARFDRAEDLIRFLATLARNKVIDEERRRILGIKYNAMRERSLEGSDPPDEAGTPSQIAMARERWSLMISEESERDRDVLRLRVSGASYDEISRRLGIHERTVRKIIGRILGSQAG